MVRVRAARTALLCLFLAFGSCGGEGGGPEGGGGRPSPEAGTKEAPATKDLNACHLLGNDEVAALSGRNVVMRDQVEATERYSTCDWSDDQGRFVFGMTVYWEGGRQEWESWMAAQGLAKEIFARAEGVDVGDVVEQGPVTGLGDGAWFSELMPSLLLRGDVLIEMKLALVPRSGTKFRGLAGTLLSRI